MKLNARRARIKGIEKLAGLVRKKLSLVTENAPVSRFSQAFRQPFVGLKQPRSDIVRSRVERIAPDKAATNLRGSG